MKKEYRFVENGQPLTEDQWKQWLAARGYDHNLAHDFDVATRATEYVREALRASDYAKQQHVDKYWPAVDVMLRASVNRMNVETVGSEDVAIPSLRQAVEVIVPRVVRGLEGPGRDLFNVKGMDRKDRRRAQMIEEWLRYQTNLSGFSEWTEDRFRSAFYYGICVVHTEWRAEFEWRLETNRRIEKNKNGESVQVIETEYKRVQTYNGCKARMVDPVRFVYDASQMDPESAQFMGERVEYTVAQLQEMERQGYLSGVDEALDPKKGRRVSLGDQHQEEQMRQHATDRTGQGPDTATIGRLDFKNANSQALVPCVILHVRKWTPKTEDVKSEDWDRWMFFMVNGLPCRIAREGLRSKLMPYAITRLCKEPNRFWGESPLMDIVRLAGTLDQVRAAAHREVIDSAGGFLVVPPGENALGGATQTSQIEPNTIFRGDPRNYAWITKPSQLGNMLALAETIRRDIRETVGAPDVISGVADGGTATQNQNNLNEANQRIEAFVKRMAFGVEHGVLRRFHALSRQFVTDRVLIRALGRHAHLFRSGLSIAPEDLQDPVDIVMVGPATLESAGQRATRIATLLNQSQFLLANLIAKGAIKEEDWLRELHLGFVGYRIDDELLVGADDPGEVMDPVSEGLVLKQIGQNLDPHPLDNDDEHLAQHLADMDKGRREKWPEEALAQLAEHIQATLDQMRRKQAQEQAAQALANRQPAAPSQIPTTRNAPQDGNEFQRTPDAGQVGSVGGQTNGPGLPHQSARMGRSSSTPQGSNR